MKSGKQSLTFREAQEAAKSSSSASRALKKLEASGLVEKRERESEKYYLTQKGKEVVETTLNSLSNLVK
jgi:DNA-binding PadR family transcriptional regulator